METVPLKLNGTHIWLVFEKLMFYENGKLKESNSFICYFNFGVPLTEPYGELIIDENRSPKVFNCKSDAEVFALNYLKARFSL